VPEQNEKGQLDNNKDLIVDGNSVYKKT